MQLYLSYMGLRSRIQSCRETRPRQVGSRLFLYPRYRGMMFPGISPGLNHTKLVVFYPGGGRVSSPAFPETRAHSAEVASATKAGHSCRAEKGAGQECPASGCFIRVHPCSSVVRLLCVICGWFPGRSFERPYTCFAALRSAYRFPVTRTSFARAKSSASS